FHSNVVTLHLLYLSFYQSLAHFYLHSFPTRRSSDLCFIHFAPLEDDYSGKPTVNGCGLECHGELHSPLKIQTVVPSFLPCPVQKDRKSTRLNSSHVAISYAVFCLKKKNERPDRRDGA